MITLIIFLFLFILLVVILRLIKAKIQFDFVFNKFNIEFKIKVFNREYNGKLKLKETKKEDDLKEKVISKKGINVSAAYKEVNQKTKEIVKLAKNIIGVLEIKKLDINVLTGLLFLTPTILSVSIISSLIPLIYHLPFKEKGPLTFKVLPIYNTLSLKVKITGEIAISLFNVLLIFILLVKKKMINFKNVVRNYNKNE